MIAGLGSAAFVSGCRWPVSSAVFNTSLPPTISGWVTDFVETFSTAHDDSRWTRYGWGLQRPTGGSMGRYDVDNVYVEDDCLKLRYRYDGHEWTSAGVSGAPSFTAVGGRWEFRARFPKGRGFGFAALLWPADEQWPPEIDIIEGPVEGSRLSGFVHLPGPRRFLEVSGEVADRSQWHTYGVQIDQGGVTFTLDGEPWAVAETTELPAVPMWFGFQTGAIDPTSEAAQYYFGGVPNGVPGAETPAEAVIELDWVAHYRRR